MKSLNQLCHVVSLFFFLEIFRAVVAVGLVDLESEIVKETLITQHELEIGEIIFFYRRRRHR